MKSRKKLSLYLVLLFVGMAFLAWGSAELSTSVAAEGTVKAKQAYPVVDKTNSVVLMEQSAPARVRLGETFDYEIKVTSLVDVELTEVEVEEHLSNIFKFVSSKPAAKIDAKKKGVLKWMLGTLGPKGSKVITVTGSASAVGSITQCALVSYKMPSCFTIEVVKPELELVKRAPSDVMLCEPIKFGFTVSNPGSGPTTNTKIVDPLPAGLETKDGSTSIMFNVGTLAPGESREFSAEVKATKVGKYINKATATADGSLKAESSTTTTVHQPVLAITKTGIPMQYKGFKIPYKVKLVNKGDDDAKDTVITDYVPSGTTFISASDGGVLSKADGIVTWKLGTLKPNDSREVSMIVKADKYGKVVNVAKAVAFCADEVSDSVETEIIGLPALLLEVIDIEDPIELGNNETYEISVTNQGDIAGMEIQIAVTLEDYFEYVSSSGPTKGTLKGNVLTFDRLSTLEPKAKTKWTVIVKTKKTGDSRFKVAMTSRKLTRPVEETESTNIYKAY
jgi:uncharacterized repeat protein (TIGR01451 family)